MFGQMLTRKEMFLDAAGSVGSEAAWFTGARLRRGPPKRVALTAAEAADDRCPQMRLFEEGFQELTQTASLGGGRAHWRWARRRLPGQRRLACASRGS